MTRARLRRFPRTPITVQNRLGRLLSSGIQRRMVEELTGAPEHPLRSRSAQIELSSDHWSTLSEAMDLDEPIVYRFGAATHRAFIHQIRRDPFGSVLVNLVATGAPLEEAS